MLLAYSFLIKFIDYWNIKTVAGEQKDKNLAFLPLYLS